MEINRESGQIEVRGPYGSVFLYTHNQVEELVHVLHDVLSKRVRWDDPDYLTRMIFCRMVPPELWNKEDHFGIGTQMYADIKILITLDIVQGKITLTEFTDTKQARGNRCSFEQFVDSFTDDAQLLRYNGKFIIAVKNAMEIKE